MKTALFLILCALLLSCSQPTDPSALPEPIPAEEPTSVPAAETPTPEPIPEPDPEPVTPPYGSTVIGETAYYVSSGAAMSMSLRTGDVMTISAAAREYERINEYEYVDNADTGRMSPWSRPVFIETGGALWVIERGYNAVKAQVIAGGRARDFGYVKEIDALPLTENLPGNKIAMSYEAGARFYRIKLYQYTDPNSWIPFQPKPIPDYILRCQEITLSPYAERFIVMGEEKEVYKVEKFTGDFVFELLSDGRVLAAGKMFRLTANGVVE
jgi:hypothetical protein